jgi:predicted dehydrogenase
MAEIINIGILGASGIAVRAVIEPSKKIPGIVPFAVAARELKKATDFALINNIPVAIEGYDQLIKHKELQAIYISTANSMHAEWICKAAAHKKHILVEKPLCLNLREYDEIEKAIRRNGIFLQEAVMVKHHPWQNCMKEIIQSQKYGRLCKIDTRFTFELKKEKNNYRYFPEMGGGVFYDLGTYWTQLLQLCTRSEIKTLNATSAFDGENGIDRNFQVSLELTDGVAASFFCSFDQPYEASHQFIFENARLRIRNFLKPALGKLQMSIDIFDSNDIKTDRIQFAEESYYQNQLFDFYTSILNGKTGLPTDARKRVEIMETIYQSAKSGT